MTSKQLPLPGFEDYSVLEELPTQAIILMAHMALRDEMRKLFDCEIGVLRVMGKLNDAQCSEALYLAQRNLCNAIKSVVIAIDTMNDMQGDSENGQ